MSKIGKVKGFIKRHGVKFVIIGGAAIGYAVGVKMLCKSINKIDTNIDIPNLTVADFGRVGEEILEKCPDVTPDTVVSAWRVGIPKNR